MSSMRVRGAGESDGKDPVVPADPAPREPAPPVHGDGAQPAAHLDAHDPAGTFAALFDTPAAGAVHLDTAGRILAVNDRCCDITGYSRDELVARALTDLSWPDDRDRDRQLLDAFLAGDAPVLRVERRWRRKDGAAVWVDLSLAALRDVAGKVVRAVGVVQDVSERKRVEDELRRGEQISRSIIESSRDCIVTLDVRGTVLSMNDSGRRRLTRRDGQEIVGSSWIDLWSAKDRSRIAEVVAGAAAGEEARYRASRPGTSGEPRWFEVSIGPVRDAEGGVERLLAVAREVPKAEQAIRENEARLRRFYESGMVGVHYFDLAGAITDANDRFLEMVGYRRADLRAGRVGWGLMTPPEYRGLDERAVVELKTRGVDTPYEKEYVRKDGTRVPIIVGAAMLDEARQHGVAFVLDIAARKKAEAERESLARQLQIALDAARLGWWSYELAAQTTAYDERSADIFGIPGLPRTMDDILALVHPDDLPRVAAAVQASLDPLDPKPYSTEYRIRRPDGTLRWIEAHGAIELEGEGPRRQQRPLRAVRLVGTVQDVTDRKRAEEAERKAAARDAFRVRLADALRPLASAGDIERAAAAVLGRELGVMRASYVESHDEWAIVHADYTDGAPSAAGRYLMRDWGSGPLADVRAGRVAVVSDTETAAIERAERAWYASHDTRALVAVPLVKGGKLTAFLTVQQRTPRAWTDDEVALVREVAELTWSAVERARAEAAMREANERLEEEDRRKNQFLAVLSHELRNPLAPIANSLYILERTAPGGEQARRAEEVIRRQVAQLTRLVDDLLDVTRISKGKIHLKRRRLELAELVRRTLDDHRSVFDEALLVLELVPPARPVFVNADPNRIAQVVGNLLHNAAKFTPAGGRVTVSVSSDPTGGQAVICVADTGVGIAPDVLGRLFEPFMQAESTLDRSKGGLGLGLALVKTLVEQHGGTVAARSEGPQRGAELEVRLPLDAPADGAEERSRQRPAPARRRVLVIEDNADAADSLRDVLELLGHEVAVAYDGWVGIARARDLRPDVVLCDIGLPGIDGYEVARALRREPALGRTVLVALSGYALPEDVQRAAEAGFARHLAKPPTVEQLEGVLGEVAAGPATPPRASPGP